jgi:hypothetical protein
LVEELQFLNNAAIDIQNSTVGMYQYRIVNGDQVQNGQLVKEQNKID